MGKHPKEKAKTISCIFFKKSRRGDLNARPTDYESVALPTELRRLMSVKSYMTRVMVSSSINQNMQFQGKSHYSHLKNDNPSDLVLLRSSPTMTGTPSRIPTWRPGKTRPGCGERGGLRCRLADTGICIKEIR